MVDIPGLIEGAAEGAGLGIRFLKHLQRTRLMLHLVDVLPPDESDIVANIKTINAELKAFSDELAKREQWLVFNKIDVMPEAEWQALVKQALKKLRWKGRWFAISAASHAGCDELAEAAMQWVEAHAPAAVARASAEEVQPEAAPAPHQAGRRAEQGPGPHQHAQHAHAALGTDQTSSRLRIAATHLGSRP
jgi:GTP-binding protein